MASKRKIKASRARMVPANRIENASIPSVNDDTTNRPSTAGRLPFDVLCHIFEQYAHVDTGIHSLEALLLVCKSWAAAALTYPLIWPIFRMSLGGIENLKMWRHRVRRRLGRCSPNNLYDIQITSDPQHKGDATDVTIFNQILSLLAGANGTLVRRWRVFKANHPLNKYSNLALWLAFPTPNLVEIDLQNLHSTRPILPVAPLLRFFRGINNTMRFPPDLSDVIELETDPNDWGENGLTGAVNVTKLKTNHLHHKPYALPGKFLMLTTLSLSWLTVEDGNGGAIYRELGELEAPALRRLNLCASSGTDFVLITRCRGLPLRLLEEVEIDCRDRIVQGYRPIEFFRDCLRGFLLTLTSLRVLELDGPLVPSLAVKILAEDCEALFHEPVLRLKLQGKQVELGSGKERLSTLKGLRRVCKLTHGKWNQIYEDLEWITSYE